MKKILGMLVVAGVVGGLAASSLTGAEAQENAYRNFKEALFRTAGAENKTVDTEFFVKRDGEIVLEDKGRMETGDSRRYSTHNVQADGKNVEIEATWSEGARVARIGDKYVSFGSARGSAWRTRGTFPGRDRLRDKIADTMVGDLKNLFSEKEGTIVLSLQGDEVPEILSLAVAAGMERFSAPDGRGGAAFRELMPFRREVWDRAALTQDVKVERIEVKAELDKDGLLAGSSVKALVSGKDRAGKACEVELSFEAKVSNVGSTLPGKLDLEGKSLILMAREGRR